MSDSHLVKLSPAAPSRLTRRGRAVRIALLTGGLAIAAVVAGGMAAVLSVVAVVPSVLIERDGLSHLLLFMGSVGGFFGGLLGPITAWTFLRRVPLWRAVLEPTAGALIGGVLGLAYSAYAPYAWRIRLHEILPLEIAAPLGLAIVGFGVAVLRLRLTIGREKSE